MVGRAPGAQHTEHHYDDATATDNYGKDYCYYGPSCIRLMRASEANAVKDDFPNADDKTTTKRKDEKWIDGSADKTNDAKSRFK